MYVDITGQYITIPLLISTTTPPTLQFITSSNEGKTFTLNNVSFDSTGYQCVNQNNNSLAQVMLTSFVNYSTPYLMAVSTLTGPNNFIPETYLNNLNTSNEWRLSSISTNYCDSTNNAVVVMVGVNEYIYKSPFYLFYGYASILTN